MKFMPSKPNASKRWLTDIRHNIYLARRFIDGLTYEAFCDNDMAFYAVTRCFEIISEASRRLPADVKGRHPEIPWIELAAAGNVYRHDYEDVRRQLVWATVQTRFPVLLEAIEHELNSPCPDQYV
jgi:uncharacterized protein with HEPN domain